MRWTKELIVEAIRELHNRGEDISFDAMKKRHSKIFFAALAKTRFGSWEKAVEAAGFDYTSVRKRTNTKWTKESLVTAIRDLHKQGADLNTSAMQRHHAAIFGAAVSKHQFGSWQTAIEAAGLLGLADIRFRGPVHRWSKLALIEAIQDIEEKGGDLSLSAMLKENSALIQSAIIPRYFGSWRAAVEAAGIDYASICKQQRIGEINVLQEIKTLFEAGDNLTSTQHPNLHHRALKQFGSWENAIGAAGVDYDQLRDVWTKEKVISKIQELAQDSHTLSWSAVRDTYPSLYDNARRPTMFGSWKNAVAAAGETITPAPLTGRQPLWTREKVLAELRELHNQGKPLWKKASDYPSLSCAARRHFKGWNDALETVGVDLKAKSWKPLNPRYVFEVDEALPKCQQVIAELQRLHSMNQPLWKRAKDYPPLSKAARENCGGWSTALEAAGIDLAPERQEPSDSRFSAPRENSSECQQIVKEIEKLYAAGKPLWKHAKDYPELNELARQYCGGWLTALKMAGVLDS